MASDPKIPQNVETSELDPGSLAAIRDLLAQEEDEVPAPSVLEARESRRVKPQARETPTLRPIAPARSATQDLPEKTDDEQQAIEVAKPAKKRKKSTPRGEGMLARLKARVTGFRPGKKLVLLTCVALMVVVWPWLVFGAIFFAALSMTGVFLILGYDGFWYKIMSLARWYARRHPSRSHELHQKLDGFAMRFDAFLDRFPEGTVDGLYLPDFGGLAAAEARHDESLDRRFDDLRDSKV